MSDNKEPQLALEEVDHSDATNSTNVSDEESDNSDIDTNMENKIDAQAKPIGDDTEEKDNINKIKGDNTSKNTNTMSDTNSEEKERLLIQRKFARSNVTRFYNKFRNLLEDSDVESVDFANLDAIMANLSQKFEQLKIIELDIQKATNLEDLDKEIESFSMYEEKYEEATASIVALKHKIDETTKEDNGNDNKTSNIKFPAIKLQSFSGKPGSIEFLEFFELFAKATEKLQKEDKFAILKSLLIFPASSIMSGLRLTSDNYDLIVERLHHKYASPKRIINRYVKLLVSFEPNKRTRNGDFSARELRSIHDRLQSYIRNLLLVDSDILTSERIILELLLCSMPKCLQIQFELSSLPKETISDFFEVFNRLVEAREATEMNSHPHHKPKWQNHDNYNGTHQRISLITRKASANRPMVPTRNNIGHQRRATCEFCQGNHPTHECTSTKVPIAERFKYLKDRNMCTFCCMKGHIKLTCDKYKRKTLTCKICHKSNHVTAFHGSIPTYSNRSIPYKPTQQNQTNTNGTMVPYTRTPSQ